jgi:hypothetical protein
MTCANCYQEIEPCARCGGGFIHVGTQYHSCADKEHFAQEATND